MIKWRQRNRWQIKNSFNSNFSVYLLISLQVMLGKVPRWQQQLSHLWNCDSSEPPPEFYQVSWSSLILIWEAPLVTCFITYKHKILLLCLFEMEPALYIRVLYIFYLFYPSISHLSKTVKNYFFVLHSSLSVLNYWL